MLYRDIEKFSHDMQWIICVSYGEMENECDIDVYDLYIFVIERVKLLEKRGVVKFVILT